ncbi:hypothetical protein SAMN05660642_00054 [Geodermatophilus siccatus]|uniref:Uncharacterized protein n=1 Tax=Geodermatophilus siccatus TaxID=1137991 RepID=A0A1G9KJU7_9ACTN|nr:hypothetical protein [Geodermatophilus siccatus]SDL50001.1 hypothetical protein SAMN05660642_00054 [Geodermatophilus siccatus]
MTSTTPQEQVAGIPNEKVAAVLEELIKALPGRASAEDNRDKLATAAGDLTRLEVIDDDTEEVHEADPADLATDGELAASEAALARAALSYLVASDPEAARLLPRAIQLVNDRTRVEPVTMLLVGGLVIAVLQTEVEWNSAESGRWKLRIHKRAMRDSTIASLVRSVLRLNAPGPGQGQ